MKTTEEVEKKRERGSVDPQIPLAKYLEMYFKLWISKYTFEDQCEFYHVRINLASSGDIAIHRLKAY